MTGSLNFCLQTVGKLKTTYRDGKIEIIGNRAGLKDLGQICMNNAELGSVETLITLNLNL